MPTRTTATPHDGHTHEGDPGELHPLREGDLVAGVGVAPREPDAHDGLQAGVVVHGAAPQRELGPAGDLVELLGEGLVGVQLGADGGELHRLPVREGHVLVGVVLVDDQQRSLRVEVEELNGDDLRPRLPSTSSVEQSRLRSRTRSNAVGKQVHSPA